jgi:hypothetical protein
LGRTGIFVMRAVLCDETLLLGALERHTKGGKQKRTCGKLHAAPPEANVAPRSATRAL